MSRVQSELILRARVDAGNSQQQMRQLGQTTEQVGRSMQGAQRSAADWRGTIVAIDAALSIAARSLAAFNAVAVEGARMALEQREGVDRLRNSLEAAGISYDSATAQIEAFAAAQQATTVYGDDVTRAIMAQVAALTAGYAPSLSEIIDMSALVQDVMARTGKSAEESGMLVTRAYTGQVDALAELLPDTRAYFSELRANGASSAELAAAAMETLNERFGGAAAAIDPARIAISRITNGIGDLREALGDAVLNVGTASGAFDQLADMIDDVAVMLGQGGEAADGFGLAIENAVDLGVQAIRTLGSVIIDTLRVLASYAPATSGMAASGRLGNVRDAQAALTQFTEDPTYAELGRVGRQLRSAGLGGQAQELASAWFEMNRGGSREALDAVIQQTLRGLDDIAQIDERVMGETRNEIERMNAALDALDSTIQGRGTASSPDTVVLGAEQWHEFMDGVAAQSRRRSGAGSGSGGADDFDITGGKPKGSALIDYTREDKILTDDLFAGLQVLQEQFVLVGDAADWMGERMEAATLRALDAQMLLAEQLNDLKVDGLQALGDVGASAFYDIASGSAALGDSLAKNTLSAIGSMASSLGSMFILAGAGATALPFLGASGPAAIAAGVGLKVLGGALGGAASTIGTGGGSGRGSTASAGTGLADSLRDREAASGPRVTATYDWRGSTIVTEDAATMRRLARGTDQARELGGTGRASL